MHLFEKQVNTYKCYKKLHNVKSASSINVKINDFLFHILHTDTSSRNGLNEVVKFAHSQLIEI